MNDVLRQQVLIDLFIVPEESKEAFMDATRTAQKFIKTLPGFVEGYLYQMKEGKGRYTVITTAVWENEEAFENAKKAVQSEYQNRGFDPRALMKQLDVEVERGVYERSSY